MLHEAALGAVPRSIEDPINANANKIDGFLNILVAAWDAKVKRFGYAVSCFTCGDHRNLVNLEDKIGRPASPNAVTKVVNELDADAFTKAFGMGCVGLRCFNVFCRCSGSSCRLCDGDSQGGRLP